MHFYSPASLFFNTVPHFHSVISPSPSSFTSLLFDAVCSGSVKKQHSLKGKYANLLSDLLFSSSGRAWCSYKKKKKTVSSRLASSTASLKTLTLCIYTERNDFLPSLWREELHKISDIYCSAHFIWHIWSSFLLVCVQTLCVCDVVKRKYWKSENEFSINWKPRGAT